MFKSPSRLLETVRFIDYPTSFGLLPWLGRKIEKSYYVNLHSSLRLNRRQLRVSVHGLRDGVSQGQVAGAAAAATLATGNTACSGAFGVKLCPSAF